MNNTALADKQPVSEAERTEHQTRHAGVPSDVPPGWTYNPSAWSQRLPLLVLALINCGIATYLALCETGVIAHAWDPFFGSGTMRVLTSPVSRAFPVPDAALGACAYLLEAACAGFGGIQRWRARPWLILAFLVVTVPLWLTSLILLILQPVVVHAWCSLCVLAAAFMLILMPLAADEVLAAIQSVRRAARRGQPFLESLLRGAAPDPADSDTFEPAEGTRSFAGFSVSWGLSACIALGLWMLVSPSILGTRGAAAAGDAISGALILIFGTMACAEVARPVRFLAAACGVWLLIFAPWSLPYTSPATRPNDVLVGVAVILCCVIRGRVKQRYGAWDRYLV